MPVPAMNRCARTCWRRPRSATWLVVDRLRTAARRALAQGVPASAVDYLRRAVREPPSTASRSAVLAELGRAEATAGRPEAMSHLQAAIELAVGAERARPDAP